MTIDASSTAKTIIYGMGSMFKGMEGLTALTWALGRDLKIHTGFWPHMSCVGSSQTGKSTLINVLNALIGEDVDVRLIDEISRTDSSELQRLTKQLNTCYNSPPMSFPWTAGVFGQDLPRCLAAIASKSIAIDLDHAKGDLYEPIEPFPVQAWADWLIVTKNKAYISELLMQHGDWILSNLSKKDAEAHNLTSVVVNYSAMMVAAELLFDFADIQNFDYKSNFKQALLNQCKQHCQVGAI